MEFFDKHYLANLACDNFFKFKNEFIFNFNEESLDVILLDYSTFLMWTVMGCKR